MLAGVEEPLSWAVCSISKCVLTPFSTQIPGTVLCLGDKELETPAFWNKRPDNLMTLLVFGSAISDGQHLQSVKSIRYLIWGWLDRALIVYWKSTKTANPLLASIPQMALKNRSVSFGVLYCQSMEFLLKPV